MRHQSHNSTMRPAPGFTLIEMMVVVLIIGLVSAIAFPKLIPLIAFSELEGQARKLANYGRATSAQALFTYERHVVRFDLDAEPQSYFTVHWVIPKEEGDGGSTSQYSKMSDKELLAQAAMEDAMPGLAEARANYTEEDMDHYLEMRGIDPAIVPEDQSEMLLLNLVIDNQFLDFQRLGLEARADNVKHPEGISAEIGPLFGKEEEFDLDKVEPEEEELADPVLQRAFLPKSLIINAISVDGGVRTRGEVEVEFTSLGLAQQVSFHLVNEDNDYYTVYWDAVAGNTRWVKGKEDL